MGFASLRFWKFFTTHVNHNITTSKKKLTWELAPMEVAHYRHPLVYSDEFHDAYTQESKRALEERYNSYVQPSQRHLSGRPRAAEVAYEHDSEPASRSEVEVSRSNLHLSTYGHQNAQFDSHVARPIPRQAWGMVPESGDRAGLSSYHAKKDFQSRLYSSSGQSRPAIPSEIQPGSDCAGISSYHNKKDFSARLWGYE